MSFFYKLLARHAHCSAGDGCMSVAFFIDVFNLYTYDCIAYAVLL